jgi:UDP-N-acetylmuramyl tripeptide synthase
MKQITLKEAQKLSHEIDIYYSTVNTNNIIGFTIGDNFALIINSANENLLGLFNLSNLNKALATFNVENYDCADRIASAVCKTINSLIAYNMV